MQSRLGIVLLGGLLVTAPVLAQRITPLASAASEDALQISRSRGSEGGVVLLWPRIIPGSEAAESRTLAAAVQARLRDMVEEALPGRAIDVRPDPERVCPQGGCEGLSVGALLLREDNGCAVVALIGGPGRAPTRMVPLAGRMRLHSPFVPFREPPESHVTITDFGQCSSVLDEFSAHRGEVEAALQSLVR